MREGVCEWVCGWEGYMYILTHSMLHCFCCMSCSLLCPITSQYINDCHIIYFFSWFYDETDSSLYSLHIPLLSLIPLSSLLCLLPLFCILTWRWQYSKYINWFINYRIVPIISCLNYLLLIIYYYRPICRGCGSSRTSRRLFCNVEVKPHPYILLITFDDFIFFNDLKFISFGRRCSNGRRRRRHRLHINVTLNPFFS